MDRALQTLNWLLWKLAGHLMRLQHQPSDKRRSCRTHYDFQGWHLEFCLFYSPEYKYRCEGEMTKGNEDKILNGLAYNPNIHDEEGPHIYISCNLQN